MNQMPENTVAEVFNVIVEDWMFGYNDLYNKEDYAALRESISKLLDQEQPLRFFLPAFPSKSPNREKVIGLI